MTLIIPVTAILAVVVIELCAIYHGVNGKALAGSMLIIGMIAGVKMKDLWGRFK